MIIIQDTREKVGHKNHILKYFERHNIQVIRQKLNVGDYCIKGKEYVTIDLKRNLLELAQNLFSDSVRFQKECIRAKNNGITLIFLIEHPDTVKTRIEITIGMFATRANLKCLQKHICQI